MLPDRVGHTHEPNELPQISMANCRVCSPLGAPVAVDVTGHTGWPHIHSSSLWRNLWPSSTRSCLWCSLGLTLAWRVLSSSQEEAEWPGTASGLAAPSSRCVPPQGKEPKHPCSCPAPSAHPGSAMVPSLPTAPEHPACPTRYQRALTISKRQTPPDPRALVSCRALGRCIPEDPPTSPK